MSIDRREYGRLESDVDHLKRQVDKLEENVEKILAMMEQGRGSWKTLMLVGGMVTTLGSFIGWIIHGWFSK